MAHIAGLVAAGVHPSPVPHADFVIDFINEVLATPLTHLELHAIRDRVFSFNRAFPLPN